MERNYDIYYHLNDPNTDRHMQCKPPEEAYLYTPNDFQIVEVDNKRPERSLRRIFEDKLDFLPFELEQMELLEKEIKIYNENKNKKKDFTPLILPPTWKKYDSLRFLHATMFKVDRSIRILVSHFEWRKSYFPFSITPKAVELLNSGFIYVHGRDSQYRPIMVIDAKFYVENMNKYTYEDFLCCVIYFIEYIINNLLIPGQVENWIILTNVNGVSIFSIPKDMKNMMGVLSSNYRCRLFINYILGMGSVLNFLWNIIKNFIDEVSLKKIKFLKKGEFGPIFDYINEEQVEQKYGGKASNVVNDFFPPKMPSENYKKTGGGLITQEEYDKLIVENKLTTISPYYLKRKEAEKKKIIEDEIRAVNIKKEEMSI
jgi:hypothetical protein